MNNNLIQTINDPRWNKLLETSDDILLDIYCFILAEHGIDSTKTEVSLLFTNDHEIQQFNHQYRNKNKPTDVLSFQQFDDLDSIQDALTKHPISLGDIILSFDTMIKDAETQNKSHQDHLIHLFVHGLLHLLGYDHELTEEAEVMEAYEIKFLAQYNIADPYQSG
ncbi:MAG: rRNA maturation RNase YbeY [Rickettsiales bacterium]|nr:rRNA maturation RNase YbeY [Rickettsiales bacterium]|tara:strand:- start:17248 stop:17742 length:495 start_codon:yes stop_codon:yes gene_type:complete